ncbi:hypothetical protein LCGC14_2288040 [marine sediment metagenome]|uniref:DUF3168 domain-containing protein n=1 Tax=marine sediment metagenome TaxID=412755 RepID=A0A0F9DEL8_9ZZZZ
MTLHEAIGYRLINSTDITALVSAAKITHGDRPQGGVPCINFFMAGYIPIANGVVESTLFQISCRAAKAEDAVAIAREVAFLFHNLKAVVNGFDFRMGTVENQLLLKEPDTELWHVPIDIRFSNLDSTVN